MIKLDSIAVALSVTILLVVMIGIATSTMGTASAATNSINKIQSGLVSSDLLTTGNTIGWTFGGTAALHNYYEDSQGLHLGVQAPIVDNGLTIMQLPLVQMPVFFMPH